MKEYYLLIDGQQVGPYTIEQLHESLAKGELTNESPAWYDGLPDWVQLGTILEEVPPVQTPVAPAPVKRPIAAPAATMAAPAVAMTSVPYTGVVQTNVKQGALLGGLVCFLLGMGFMYFSLFSFIFYGPLFLVALILSVVAMAQGRVAGGVILLLVSLVVPTIVGLILFSERASTALASFAPPTSSHTDVPVNVADSSTPAPTVTPTSDTTPAPSNSTTNSSSPANASPVVIPPTPAVQPSAPPAPKHPALDAKMGFRTYKLGTPFSQFNPDDLDAETFFEKSDTKPYGVKVFDKQLGAAEIDSIQLNFLQDLLQSIRVTVKGKQSSLALKEALITAYGQPDDTSQMMGETDTWNGDDCVLVFRIDVIDEGSTAIFSSNSVDAKIKAITEQKAKAGAAAGAQNL
jgi:hypothetical protein